MGGAVIGGSRASMTAAASGFVLTGDRYAEIPYAISPGEWHPLHAGDPSARMSKVICLSQWTEPYYQSACERFAQFAFVLMERNGLDADFETLVDLLDDPTRCNLLVPSRTSTAGTFRGPAVVSVARTRGGS